MEYNRPQCARIIEAREAGIGNHVLEDAPQAKGPPMKAAALTLAILSAGLLAALVAALFTGGARREGVIEARPTSGMALLDGWPCRRAETKEVYLHGVEDDYSSLGAEPAGSRLVGMEPQLVNADYDEAIADSTIVDEFELPSRIASGVLLVRVRSIDDRDNDAIAVGDFRAAGPHAERPIFYANFNRLAEVGGWRRAGDLVWTSFSELRLNSGASLLDHIRSDAEERSVGVMIADDSMVDFMGAAVCLEPAGKSGLTYGSPLTADTGAGFAAFACHVDGSADCNPFAGDRPCDSQLPLLCFRDRDAPGPRALSQGDKAFSALRRWSGGEVAATPPVSGLTFATIGEADGACASAFGEGWRVADWHIGGTGQSFTARSGGRAFSGRYWIDIKDQPYATCWSRDDDA